MLLSLDEKKKILQLILYKQNKSIKYQTHTQENKLQTLSKLGSCKIQYQ